MICLCKIIALFIAKLVLLLFKLTNVVSTLNSSVKEVWNTAILWSTFTKYRIKVSLVANHVNIFFYNLNVKQRTKIYTLAKHYFLSDMPFSICFLSTPYNSVFNCQIWYNLKILCTKCTYIFILMCILSVLFIYILFYLRVGNFS